MSRPSEHVRIHPTPTLRTLPTQELHPVVVLLSLMLWSALWGVTGMVLAVPLTAVLRIHLTHIDHPLPRLLLRLLDGGTVVEDEPRASDADVDDELHRDDDVADERRSLLPA